jgi:hypothetical protein
MLNKNPKTRITIP